MKKPAARQLLITPGQWERCAYGVWAKDGQGHNLRLAIAEIAHSEGVVLRVDSEEQSVANMDLFAEAGTVANETGLTPRQLADRKADLLEALKAVTRCLEEHINEEAKSKGVNPEVLCPCLTNEIVQAQALIAKEDAI